MPSPFPPRTTRLSGCRVALRLPSIQYPSARSKHWAAVVWVAVVLLGIPRCLAFLDDATDARELLKQAVDGWKQLRTLMIPTNANATAILKGESTDRNDKDFGKENVLRYVYKFWLTEKSEKIVIDLFDGSGKWQQRRVMGSNPDYGFMARQATEDGPYYITECVRDRQPLDHVNSALHAFGVKLLAPICVGGEELPEIVTRDSFNLLGARTIEMDGRKFVEFQMSFVQGVLTAGDSKTPVHCTIVVDPAAGWRVVHTSLEKQGQSTTMEVSYGAGERTDDLRKVVLKRTFSDARNSEIFEMTSISHDTLPDSEFYLGAIGLPDCPTLGACGNHRLLFIATNLLIIAVIFALLYHRRRALARVSPPQ